MLYIGMEDTLMKFIITALFVMLSMPAIAMGRLPSDPATYGDIQNLDTQISAINQTDVAQEAEIQDKQAQLNELNKLKVQMGTTIRLYDAKYGSLNFFGLYDVQGTGGNAVGLNVGLKLGKSYEQRLIEKQQKQIDLLMQKLTNQFPLK